MQGSVIIMTEQTKINTIDTQKNPEIAQIAKSLEYIERSIEELKISGPEKDEAKYGKIKWLKNTLDSLQDMILSVLRTAESDENLKNELRGFFENAENVLSSCEVYVEGLIKNSYSSKDFKSVELYMRINIQMISIKTEFSLHSVNENQS